MGSDDFTVLSSSVAQILATSRLETVETGGGAFQLDAPFFISGALINKDIAGILGVGLERTNISYSKSALVVGTVAGLPYIVPSSARCVFLTDGTGRKSVVLGGIATTAETEQQTVVTVDQVVALAILERIGIAGGAITLRRGAQGRSEDDDSGKYKETVHCMNCSFACGCRNKKVDLLG